MVVRTGNRILEKFPQEDRRFKDRQFTVSYIVRVRLASMQYSRKTLVAGARAELRTTSQGCDRALGLAGSLECRIHCLRKSHR